MLTLLLALACSEPPPQAEAPTAEAEATPNTPQPTATAPADAGTQPSPDQIGVPVLEHRPEGADQAGAVVMLTGTIENSKLAQVRLMAIREGKAEVFDLRAATDGRFFAEAPAQWDEPIYLSAVEVDPDNPSTVATGWGAVAEPVTLAGEDLHVSMSIGEHPAWTEGVTPSLAEIVDAGPLNAARAGQE